MFDFLKGKEAKAAADDKVTKAVNAVKAWIGPRVEKCYQLLGNMATSDNDLTAVSCLMRRVMCLIAYGVFLPLFLHCLASRLSALEQASTLSGSGIRCSQHSPKCSALCDCWSHL